MTPVISLLKAARDHIAGPGMFWPGRYFKGRPDELKFAKGMDVPNVPCFAMGAIGFASSRHPEDFDRGKTQRLATQELNVTIRKYGLGGTISFSDTPGRTQADIVGLFTDAIKRLEATP